MRVPLLRFAEFGGEWEEKILGDIASFSKGKNISKADIANNGIIECIRYGELYTHYKEIIIKIISKTNIPKDKLVLSQSNDVIIPASGESSIDIATASCVIKNNIALGSDLNIIRTKENGIFLSYYLNNTKKLEIAKLAQGISVVHLYGSQLKILKLKLPPLPEQQKIAQFLTSVDKKIDQLSTKKRLLEQYKKGMMQKLFSQEIRFKDDEGKDYPDWVDNKLGDIASRSTLKNKENLIHIVLTNSATQGIVKQTEYFDKDIANKNNLNGYYIVNINSFVYNPRISSSAPVGPINRNKIILGVMSPLYTVFIFNNINLNFIEHYFNTAQWHKYMYSIANFGARHDRMNITMTDFMKMPILSPSLPEQQKIANFLSSIDNKITKTTQQLTQTQQFKKALLQQMFV